MGDGFRKNQKPFNANDADETNNANFYLFREIRPLCATLAPHCVRCSAGVRVERAPEPATCQAFLRKPWLWDSRFA
jgi:hypothetical protein